MGKNGGLRPAVFFGVAAATASGQNESMNTRNVLFVSALALAAVATPCLAQQNDAAVVTPSVTAAGAVVVAPPAATSAAPAAPAAESEVVCRMVKVTGTRLRKERVCTSNVTREQSAEWLRNQQDHGNNIGSNAAVNGGG